MPIKDKSLHPKNDESQFINFLKDVFYGEPPEIVKSKPITGRINSTTRRNVTIRIKEIVDNCDKFKIGATGDTLVRVDKKDYRKEYDFIQRVFCSKSEGVTKDFEVEIIKKFMKLYPDKNQNKSVARAGKLTSYDGKFYIYVVYS